MQLKDVPSRTTIPQRQILMMRNFGDRLDNTETENCDVTPPSPVQRIVVFIAIALAPFAQVASRRIKNAITNILVAVSANGRDKE